jgi:hypothetical protein
MANRKISDLTALTTPATGDLLPIVDISEAAAADKNKKITFGELFASIPLGTAAAPSVAFEGYPGTGVYSSGADQVAISTNGTGQLFVTSGGTIKTSGHISLAGASAGGARYLALLDETSGYTGSYVLQAGGGSSGFGGAITMYGHSHASYPGSVYIGASTSSGGSLIFGANNALDPAGGNARIDSSGRLLIGGSADSGGALLQVFGDRIRIGTAKTPASATATGTTGEIAWDANYIYVCTATNTWKRVAISTW